MSKREKEKANTYITHTRRCVFVGACGQSQSTTRMDLDFLSSAQ